MADRRNRTNYAESIRKIDKQIEVCQGRIEELKKRKEKYEELLRTQSFTSLQKIMNKYNLDVETVKEIILSNIKSA